MNIKQGLQIKQGISQKLKLVGRMKLGEFFSLPEDKFKAYIEKIEKDPIFQELKDKYRLVRYKKFPDIKRRTSSLPLKEELVFQEGDVDIEGLLEENPKALPILKKVGEIIGINEFREFLHKGNIKMKEIAERCSLSSQEVEIFKDFINKFQIQSVFELSPSSLSSSSPPQKLFKVAAIEKRGNNLVICPLEKESYLIKGKYSINYERFQELVKNKILSSAEINRISSFLKKLDLINRRTTTLYQILYYLKESQREFFETGDPKNLSPLTQNEIARHLKINPSSVSRTIANKSILTPQKEEKPLKFFFSKRRLGKYFLEIIKEEKRKMKEGSLSRPLSDKEIKERLEKRYNLTLSRRTICKYRAMLNIPPSFQR
ncbi:hypothetical protein J7K28_07905 [Candidatus Aerophobetes bacterium]|nr:hypothetical protein [Candidatus Aerophobetes bacterium]